MQEDHDLKEEIDELIENSVPFLVLDEDDEQKLAGPKIEEITEATEEMQLSEGQKADIEKKEQEIWEEEKAKEKTLEEKESKKEKDDDSQVYENVGLAFDPDDSDADFDPLDLECMDEMD